MMESSQKKKVSTSRRGPPREKTRMRFYQPLVEAGERGLTFTELVKRSGLSRSAVNACLYFYKDSGDIEKVDGRWKLKKFSIEAAEELKFWIDRLDKLDERMRNVMLERIDKIKDRVSFEHLIEIYTMLVDMLRRGIFSKEVYRILQRAPLEFLNVNSSVIRQNILNNMEKISGDVQTGEEAIRLIHKLPNKGGYQFQVELLKKSLKIQPSTGFNFNLIFQLFPSRISLLDALLKIYNEEVDAEVKGRVLNVIRELKASEFK